MLKTNGIEMMEENEKQFPCTKAECDMKCTNLNHLNLQTSKHHIALNLGIECNKSSSFAVVDQTPTPTRFIRNCEEVGLFQDLQNVNPFDETFRKAVELVKTGSLHIPNSCGNSDDSLHTPHILPHIIEENRNKFINKDNESEPTTSEFSINTIDADIFKISDKELSNSNEIVNLEDSNKINCDNDQCEIIDLTESDLRIHNEVDIKTESSDTSLHESVTEALKNKLKNELGHSDNQNKNIDSAIIIAPIKLEKIETLDCATIIIKRKPDPALCRSPRKRIIKRVVNTNNGKKFRSDVSDTEIINETLPDQLLDSKEKQRAMNRAAQIRSRERKKNWISEMEKKVEHLSSENKRLSNENGKLKKDLAILNITIKYHKDCSVSKDEKKVAELKSLIEKNLKLLETKKNIAPKSKVVPIRPHPTPTSIVSNIGHEKMLHVNGLPFVISSKPVLLPQTLKLNTVSGGQKSDIHKNKSMKKLNSKLTSHLNNNSSKYSARKQK